MPAPEPAPAFTPPPVNWMDQPASPGNWFYVARPPYSMAVFGSSERDFDFAMRCDPASRTVSLGRVSGLTSPQPMRVLTETASRTLSAQPRQGSIEQLLAADLAAGDPLLDAMAISKGRFAVETGGMPVLYIPSWPEVTRVIEDCR